MKTFLRQLLELLETVDAKEVDVNQLIGNVDTFPDSGSVE
jgi:hypothetical protein